VSWPSAMADIQDLQRRFDAMQAESRNRGVLLREANATVEFLTQEIVRLRRELLAALDREQARLNRRSVS
jgi:hypothetical protein